MCGIAGIISQNKIDKNRLIKIGAILKHRGPDSQNFFHKATSDYNVGLIHNRLAIQDTSSNANQPMFNDEKDVVIIFNGEVYNFKELKKSHLKGCSFKTESDTEVLLLLYQIYGIKMLSFLRGMFAIAILDLKLDQLFLIRDRIGVKPLYYTIDNQELRFASELKGVIEEKKYEINKEAVKYFLELSYIPGNLSIYKSIYKLMPGEYLRYDIKNKKVSKNKYWNLNSFIKEKSFKLDLNILKDDFERSINLRAISDVPISVFQSGGYDSTLVSSVLKNHGVDFESFNIGFKTKKYDESLHAKKIASHIDLKLNTMIFDNKALSENLIEVFNNFDEPFADPSSLPTALLSKYVCKTHKVALSGDGGDELFSGYDKHRWILVLFRISNSIFKHPIILSILSLKLIMKKLRLNRVFKIRNLNTRLNKIVCCLESGDPIRIFEIVSKYITEKEINKILGDVESSYSFSDFSPTVNDPLKKIIAVDLQTHLPDQILYKVDRCSMIHSIEARDPLVDHQLIEKYINLESSSKRKYLIPKYPIRKLVWKIIPKRLMDKPKMGFSIPVKELLKNELKPLVEELLSHENLSHKIFNIKEVSNICNSFYKGEDINERKLWHILVFQLWYFNWKNNIKV